MPSISIDVSSPARANGSTAFGTTAVTSGSFNPPAGVLVACTSGNGNQIPATGISGAMTNNGAALTWTTIVERGDFNTGGNAEPGYAGIHAAVLGTSRSGMTVTLTLTASTADNANVACPTVKLYVLTGDLDTSDPPGVSDKNSSNLNSLIATLLPDGTSSLGFVVTSEWNALGNAIADDFTYEAFTNSAISGGSGYQPLSGPGSTNQFVLEAPAGSARWNWVTAEIHSDPGGGYNPPADIPPNDPVDPNSVIAPVNVVPREKHKGK